MTMSKLRSEYTIDRLHERQKGSLPGLLGVRVTGLEEGVLTAELTVRSELLAPNGFLHAATVIGLADTACGYACLAHLPDNARNFTTIELKSNFVSGPRRKERSAPSRRPCIWAAARRCGTRR
jgi:1,4-dihydroxy-2-naphthoyl-CoA hydrolase